MAQVEESESRQKMLKEIDEASTERFFIQGYLTDSWHSLQRTLLLPPAPKGTFPWGTLTRELSKLLSAL